MSVLSWLGMIANISSYYIMPKNKRLAIQILLFGSLFWIPWAILDKAWAILTIQCFYVILNIRTLRMWKAASGREGEQNK